VSWIEPFEYKSPAVWYGPRSDKSWKAVANIKHKMNMEHHQVCWCCLRSEVSRVYHSEVKMPTEYGTSEWHGLLGWVLFIDQLDAILPLFGGRCGKRMAA
jgi:hypothetical protein